MPKKALVGLMISSMLTWCCKEVSSNDTINVGESTKRTHVVHPSIDGFTYCYGYEQKVLACKNQYGYIYYDMDLYYTPFTSVSNLYLIHVKGEFTSGYVANKTGQSGFNSMYDLDGGMISIKVKQVVTNMHRSSSLTTLIGAPNSSNINTTVISQYGSSLTLGSQFQAGVSLSNISLQKISSIGLNISQSTSISSVSQDPIISHQTDSEDINKDSWLFTYASYGRITYQLDTYYLFEAKGDGANFQDYSFSFEVGLKLDAVAWHGYLWENHKYVEHTFYESFGLY